MDYHNLLHDSLIGWLRPYLSLFSDLYCWMAACIPISQFLYTLLWMAAPMPHVHVSEISVVFVIAGSPTAVLGSIVFS